MRLAAPAPSIGSLTTAGTAAGGGAIAGAFAAVTLSRTAPLAVATSGDAAFVGAEISPVRKPSAAVAVVPDWVRSSAKFAGRLATATSVSVLDGREAGGAGMVVGGVNGAGNGTLLFTPAMGGVAACGDSVAGVAAAILIVFSFFADAGKNTAMPMQTKIATAKPAGTAHGTRSQFQNDGDSTSPVFSARRAISPCNIRRVAGCSLNASPASALRFFA